MKTIYIYILMIFAILNLNANDNYFYQNGKKVYIEPLAEVQTSTLSKQQTTEAFVKTENNNILQLTNEILLQSDVEIEDIINNYPITLIKKLSNNTYLVKVDDNEDVVTIANRLYEDKDISFAHPNFIKKMKTR